MDNTASCSDLIPAGGTLCDAPPSITPVTISSSLASTTMASVGTVVTLSFTSNQAALLAPSVTILGRAATVLAGTNNTWTASTTIQTGDSEGVIPFSATIGNNDGLGTTTVTSITSGSNVSIDTTSPVITLNGSNPDSMSGTAAYTDPGASAVDAHDGAVAVTAVSTINTSAAGTYSITYTATDAAGNSATAVRTVVVHATSGNGPVSGSYGAPSSSGGGGGGGGSPTTTSFNVLTNKSMFTGTQASGTRSSTVGSVCTTAVPFTRTLGRGMKGADVRRLQLFVNSHGFVVASSGDGSPGNESDQFGGKTEAAVIRFQKANALAINLVKFTGLFGQATRAYVNGLAPSCTPSTPATASAFLQNSSFTRDLQLSDTGEDVRALQQFLNVAGFLVARTGPGSPGHETTVFGIGTYRALSNCRLSAVLPLPAIWVPKPVQSSTA